MTAGIWACLSLIPSQPGSKPPDLDEGVAAVVDNETILVRELERELALAMPQKDIPLAVRESLLAKTLEQLVGRKLVQRWLADSKQAASDADVDLARDQLQSRLKQRGSTLNEFLQQQQLDEAGLRRSLAWQLGWGRFLDKQLTDANMERYFQQHRREFDGSEVHVAHILFKPNPPDSPQALEATRGKARQVLQQIRMGTVTFAETARTNSEGPSKDAGGDIGWISRHEPMPESFSSAAFALEPKQVSDPVVTTFGVHLIQCLEVRAGPKRWQDVRSELEQAMTRYLFDWASSQARPRSNIRYSSRFVRILSTEPAPSGSR